MRTLVLVAVVVFASTNLDGRGRHDGDNIAVYVPLLVGKSWIELTIVTVVFGLMTAVWCVVALFVVNHPRTGPPIKRFGRVLVLWIYMGLGIYILVGSRAYTLVGLGG